MQNEKTKLIFDDCIDIINEEIFKRRHKWKLTAIQWLDFHDIAQIIRIHIYEKWHMWDQTRPLRPWLHSIVVNQIYNIIRNTYGNHCKPCLQCSAYEGDNLCRIYTTQNTECPLYAYWTRTKKSAHDIKLPVALEFHMNELSEKPEYSVDIEQAAGALHEKMKEILKPMEYKVYKYLYIDNENEEDIGRLLGFKTTEKARAAGYRQVKNIKDSILQKAKKVVYDNEIDF